VIGAPIDLGPDPRGRARLEAVSVLPYCLPLRHPWQSARGLTSERRGWLVRAESDGVRGYGDCAPLTQAGTESASDAERTLKQWQERLPGLGLDAALSLLAAQVQKSPAACYAVECALLDLQSRLAGVSLRRWIAGPDTDPLPDCIEVNAMLGPSPQVSGQAIGRAIDAGFRVLKVKVGCSDPEAEIAHLAGLARALPSGVRLRLDANGAWDWGTAERVIAALNALPMESPVECPVESLEEPLSPPDPAGLARLQALASFPLALDESLPHWIQGPESGAFPVRRAVIKPAVFGGVAATLRLAERLRVLGIEVVLTGLIDSAAGLWATAQVAAAVASPIPHGLATSDWLAQDLGVPPIPRAGRIELPGSPGAGFNPDRLGENGD